MLTANELGQYSYFSGLSSSALEELAGRLESVQFPAGARILRQGAPPDYFYFVEKGEIEVTRRNQFGQEAMLRVLSGGQGFGETALLACSHRTCLVTARTDSVLLRLGKKDFEDVVLMDSAFKGVLMQRSAENTAYNRVKSYRPFALLDPEKMLALADKLTEERFGQGEDIIRQGDPPGPYYIIKSGRVSVLKGKQGQVPEQVAVLSEGESFGEEAIIRDQGRNATVRAVDETTVLSLTKKDFNKILLASYLQHTFPEDISMEERGMFVFIDARVPAEYEEEHIEGAVNIPIEALRGRYPELDPGQEYLTYCTNDSRGMAAAFLLGVNGFKAKCLRGGLSGWTGPVTSSSDGIHLPVVTA